MNIKGKISIDTTEDYTRILKFRKNRGYDSENFAEADEIIVAFKNQDDTFLLLDLDAGVEKVSGQQGDIKITLTKEQTALLKRGVGLNLEVTKIVGGIEDKKKLIGCVDVIVIESAT